jgi:hypothetical protein
MCYRRASYDVDAARCYRLAGAHRRAAEIYEAEGDYITAAEAYADAGLPEVGAWLLVHLDSKPDRARALLATPGQPGGSGSRPEPEVPGLRRHLVLARCEIAEGAAPDTIRPVIAETCTALADPSARSDQVTEEWAVALSEAAQRFDQAALVFAAAVRGGRYGADQRWKAWARDVLQAEIIVPPPAARAVPPATTTVPTSAA